LRADPLFQKLYTRIKKIEISSFKEPWLQALRGIITPAGDQMSESIYVLPII
jgi:hypothetical protein